MTTLPLCDLDTLLAIESRAPHLLTAHDRHCLRAHRAAPVVRSAVPTLVLACGVALALLPWGFLK